LGTASPYFEFTFLTGLFNGFLNQFIVPFIVERGLVSDYGFNLGFQFVMAAFAEIPMGQVKTIAPHNGSGDSTLANITGKGLHNQTPSKL
jgi:hypothetical protein